MMKIRLLVLYVLVSAGVFAQNKIEAFSRGSAREETQFPLRERAEENEVFVFTYCRPCCLPRRRWRGRTDTH